MGCKGAAEAKKRAWMDFCRKSQLSLVNWAIVAIDECSTLKPTVSPTGGWADTDLTESGLMVKEIIKNWPDNAKWRVS